MLHQLMWECCWSLTANKLYVYGSDMTAPLFLCQSQCSHTERQDRNTDLATRTEKSTRRHPRHPSSSHLHLVDVGWVVPAAAQLSGSLTAAVRHYSAVCVSGANPDALSPVG